MYETPKWMWIRRCARTAPWGALYFFKCGCAFAYYPETQSTLEKKKRRKALLLMPHAFCVCVHKLCELISKFCFSSVQVQKPVCALLLMQFWVKTCEAYPRFRHSFWPFLTFHQSVQQVSDNLEISVSSDRVCGRKTTTDVVPPGTAFLKMFGIVLDETKKWKRISTSAFFFYSIGRKT